MESERNQTHSIFFFLELLRVCSDIINSILKIPQGGEESHIQIENGELLTNNPKNVGTLLECLTNKDVYVRVSICQILEALVRLDKLSVVQACVLSHPMGVSKLMDVLRDPRDYVRNEGLLLMGSLCKGNQEIQKITAFDSAFECIFTIIEEELGGDEVIVIDALHLMRILLDGNSSNIVFFREIGCAERLLPLLKVEGSDVWMLTEKRQEVIVCALHVVRALLPRDSSSIAETHRLLHKLGFSNVILKLALGRVNSLSVRTMALEALSDFLLDENVIRKWFGSTTVFLPLQGEAVGQPDMARLALPRLITVLLHTPSFNERIAALGALYCFLRNNEDAQISIVTSFTPSPNDIDDEVHRGISLDSPSSQSSIGRRLLACLFGWQKGMIEKAERSWFSSKVLGQLLKNPTIKLPILQRPLRIQMGEKELNMLMESLVKELHNVVADCQGTASSNPSKDVDLSDRKIILVSILNLLCTWLFDLEAGVKGFINDPKNIPLLAELTTGHHHFADIHIQGSACLLIAICLVFNPDEKEHSFNRENLRRLIASNIGKEKFTSALSRIRFSREFIEAEQDDLNTRLSYSMEEEEEDPLPLPLSGTAWDTITFYLYDYDFTLMYKNTYDYAIKILGSSRLRGPLKESNETATTTLPPQQESAIRAEYEQQLAHYKQLLDGQAPHIIETQKLSGDLRSLLSSGGAGIEIQEDWSVKDALMNYKVLCEELIQQKGLLEETVQSMTGIITDYERLLPAQGGGDGSPLGGSSGGLGASSESLEAERQTMSDIIEKLETENTLLREQSENDQQKLVELLDLHENSVKGNRVDELEASLQQMQLEKRALDAEQEELLLCLVKEEMETGKLRETVRQLTAELQQAGLPIPNVMPSTTPPPPSEELHEVATEGSSGVSPIETISETPLT